MKQRERLYGSPPPSARDAASTENDRIILADLHAGHGSGVADIARNVELRPVVRERLQPALEEIRLADEVGDKLVDGNRFCGEPICSTTPERMMMMRSESAIASLWSRNVNGGDADLLLDAADLRAHRDAQLGVQVGERLVEEQNARLNDERAGERHTLLLTAGELVGHAALHTGELHEIKDLHHALADLFLRHVAQLETVATLSNTL